jgi:hypothetical protein
VTDVEERPRFYEGQYLEAADLTAAVDYSRTQLSRAMLAAHRWGIALGLDLTEVDGPNSTVDVFIQPGYAWDGFGRPILVPEPTKLSRALFSLFDAAFTPANPAPPPVLVDVWLNYAEMMTQGPRPGFQTCDTADAFARVQESFRIEVGPRAALNSQRDPVEIAGRLVDAATALSTFDSTAAPVVDGDVPQQSLPVADTNRWLIPLGVVSWQPGNPGRFTKRDAAGLDRSARTRQYCGAVAGSIEANGGHVTVHDRSAAYPVDYTDDLLWVAGTTRADADVRLYGSKLALVSTHSETPIKPFQVARTDDASGQIALRLVIGDQAGGDNRLVIGPESAPGVYTDRMVVTDAGKVGIGTTTPKAPLHVVADGIEIGADTPATKNFYLQVNDDASAPQVRGLRIYNNDVGAGTHIATFADSGRVGIGTTAPASPLHVASVLGIQQGTLYLSGDDRWSSLTFNAHHDAANGTWVFPTPAKPAVTIEMDAIDGSPRFEVFATPPGVNTSWRSRLKVAGHTGDVLMGMSGGSLGIGTITPAARIDVVGDIQASGNVRMGGLFAAGADQAVRLIWGVVDSNGNRVGGTGFTMTRTTPGRYLITFDVAFSAQPTVVASRVYGDPGIDAGSTVAAGETAVVDLVMPNQAIVATAAVSGALADGGFTFIAIGPR